MITGQVINGYKILRDGTLNGMCSWTFARKSGKDYFIKEFLYPTYPTVDSPGSPKTKERKKLACESFEQYQAKLIGTISSKCSAGGNIIYAIDFFRNGTKYYKVTEKVDVASIPLSEISLLDLKKQILIMTTVAFSLKILHDIGIVHGDLKPDNILIKKIDSGLSKLEGGYTTKLIDFDNSFFDKAPPELTEEVVGDIAYYSPELLRYVKNDDATKREDLTTKSDIFALGLIFCKYLTNNFPAFNKKKYGFVSVACNNGEIIKILPDSCPPNMESLINSMLAVKPSDRPDIKDVHLQLKALLGSNDTKLDDTGKSRLKISKTLKQDGLSETLLSSPSPTPLPAVKPGSRVKFGKGLNK